MAGMRFVGAIMSARRKALPASSQVDAPAGMTARLSLAPIRNVPQASSIEAGAMVSEASPLNTLGGSDKVTPDGRALLTLSSPTTAINSPKIVSFLERVRWIRTLESARVLL